MLWTGSASEPAPYGTGFKWALEDAKRVIEQELTP